MKMLKGRNCSIPSMQQRKVKPLEAVVYLPKSENIVAVKLASSLYKLSLQTRETQDLPKDWKDGIIVPVFKKGRRKDSGNYRGISLLSKDLDSHTPQQTKRTRCPHIVPETRCGIRSAW